VRAGLDIAVVREPAQARDRQAERLGQCIDVLELGQRVVASLLLGIGGVEAIDIGGVVPEHARPEVDDVGAAIGLPRAAVQLAPGLALLVAARLVLLLLGVGRRGRDAGIREALPSDLLIDPRADAASRGDVGPAISGRGHGAPSCRSS